MDFSFKLARNGLRRVCVDPDGGDPPVLYHAPCIGRSGWSAATAAPCGVHLPVRARATEQHVTPVEGQYRDELAPEVRVTDIKATCVWRVRVCGARVALCYRQDKCQKIVRG